MTHTGAAVKLNETTRYLIVIAVAGVALFAAIILGGLILDAIHDANFPPPDYSNCELIDGEVYC